VSVGTFDGVHLGHRAILARLQDVASRRGLERIVLAFVLPPRCAMQRSKATRCLLAPLPVRAALLRPHADRLEWISFPDVRRQSAQAFIEGTLVGKLGAEVVVVGERFRLGHHRDGDVALLRHLLGDDNVVAVPEILHDGEKVSSSRIRELLARGEIRDASALLGRPPVFTGVVERGDGIGASLGYPTANLAPPAHQLMAADGVYLALAYGAGVAEHGLLYIGYRPTLAAREHRVELHLLRPPVESLDGHHFEVHLLERVRDDHRFEGLHDLREALARDVDAVRRRLVEGDLPLPRRIVG